MRLPDDQGRDLDLVSVVDGVPLAEVIRAAISDFIAIRRADPEFQARLRDHAAAVTAWSDSGRRDNS